MLEQIATYLKTRDWNFESVDTDTLVTGFTVTLADGNDQGFSLYIMRIEDAYADWFVRFTIVPFIEQPYEGYPDSLYPAVGQINHDLPILKFAFDGDGDLELVADVPEAQLDQAEFDRIVQLLVDYAGANYSEIQSLLAE